MRAYRIFYYWKHVQGHDVTSEFTKKTGAIPAENTDDAIEKFKELNPDMGRHIKKNEKGYFYGDFPTWRYDNKPLEIKEVELVNTKQNEQRTKAH